MIAAAIGPLSTLLDDVLKRVIPDSEQRAKLQAELQTELLKADLNSIQGQLAVNEAEARHEGVFVAGWRPFTGWVCGAALAYNYVAQPLLAFLFSLCAGHLPPLPILDTGSLVAVLTGMLGLGGMRSFEKYSGVNLRR